MLKRDLDIDLMLPRLPWITPTLPLQLRTTISHHKRKFASTLMKVLVHMITTMVTTDIFVYFILCKGEI